MSDNDIKRVLRVAETYIQSCRSCSRRPRYQP
jgi:hypothetical protein